MINLFLTNLKFGPWQEGKSIFWFVKFLFANFGVLFILLIIFCLLILLKRIKISKNHIVLFVVMVILITIPFTFSFTIDRADMLKFFYIAFIPMSILAAIVAERILHKKFGYLVVFLILFSSMASGLIDLSGSFLNRNYGYSQEDLDVGNWIMKNTPQNSIFLTNYTIHNPITDIAGRMRVLSYTTWPYTHGFNIGSDNVFSRQRDIDAFYKDPNVFVINKYKVNYIYLGPDERSNFPEVQNKLESNIYLKKVYDKDEITIFAVRRVSF